jgi:protein-S-isoprenylcysteine O-methyltransferase Ste14
MIAFDMDLVAVIQFVLAVVLPLVVGIVTTRAQSPAFKAVTLAFLALLTSLGTELAQTLAEGGTYDLGEALLRLGGTFVVAVAMHFGVWSRPNAEGVSVSKYLQENVGRKAA